MEESGRSLSTHGNQIEPTLSTCTPCYQHILSTRCDTHSTAVLSAALFSTCAPLLSHGDRSPFAHSPGLITAHIGVFVGGLASLCYSMELGSAPLILKQAELEQPYSPDSCCDELLGQACCVYCPPGSFCYTVIGGQLSGGGRIQKLVCLAVNQHVFVCPSLIRVRRVKECANWSLPEAPSCLVWEI